MPPSKPHLLFFFVKIKGIKIETDRQNKAVRAQYKGIKDTKNGYQPRTQMIRSKDGRLLIGEDEVKGRWKEYFQELLNRPEPDEPLQEPERDEQEVDNAMEELEDTEIRKAIKRLKNNKATGIDGINAELMKYGGEAMEEELLVLYKKIWREMTILDEWHEGIYVPLHKKHDRHDCVNYRGLCLLTIGYEILSSILCQKLLPHYLRIIGDYQAGFVPGKSTVDNIFILRQLTEKYREYGQSSWHVFIDYRQAYDSVHRPSLWVILQQFQVPQSWSD